jgi:L-seryl-tRNA(Ser) seleniumtransferase
LGEIYDPYEKYGIRRVVNAATSLTILGGSVASPEVYEAMDDASKSFVYIPELQRWAGEYIAEATGAEAGLPTSGASNGLTLAAAACIMKGTELEEYDPLAGERWSHLTLRLPMHTEGLRTEFIVQKCCRNVYDHAVECAGGRFVEVGDDDCTTLEELDNAFDPERTAAYYFTARQVRKGLPLEDVVEIAHRNGAPVIVDAAAEVPPMRKLKMYIEKGADLVIYSGGKHPAGPNNSGLLAGRVDLIKLAHLQAYPFHAIGRAAKMSRETIVGLVTALKIYMEHDEGAAFEAWERKVKWMIDRLGAIPGIEAGKVYQKVVEDGEPTAPMCSLVLDEGISRVSGRELVERLKDGDPRIWVLWEPAFLLGEGQEGKICINPQYMLDGEEEIVVERIKGLLGA